MADRRIKRERFDGDRYLRGGRCWAKISGKRGAWRVSLGWKDQVKAVRSNTTDRLAHAEVIALGWIEDHGF